MINNTQIPDDHNRENHGVVNRIITVCMTITVCALWWVVYPTAQAQDQAADDHDTNQTIPAEIEGRLEKLHPDNPDDYFNLGEDMLDERRFELSNRLFVIAAHLDPKRLGRSACLALAESARLQNDAGRAAQMRAMARMFPAQASSAVIALDEKSPPEEEYRHAGALVSAMLGDYRTGYGTRGIKALNLDRNAYALLSRFERGIGSVADVLSYCKSNTRCDLCENKLYIEKPTAKTNGTTTDGSGTARENHYAHEHDYQVCPRLQTYRPQLTTYRLTHLLDVETALAGGRHARWGARLALDFNTPRPVLDPAFLSRAYAVDPEMCVYRDHEWIGR